MAIHVADREEMRYAYKILMRKSEAGRPIGRRRLRWEGNIEMDFKVIGNKVVYWICEVQDRIQ
jgi:hypothetical protein